MSRWLKRAVGVLLVLVAVALGGACYVARGEAHRLITNPRLTRAVSAETPRDRGMAYEDVEVQSADGTRLRGWFIPAASDRLVLVQHGYKNRLQAMLGVAEVLHRHDYQVMLICVRAHDRSDGELIGFGDREMPDMEAFARVAAREPGVNPAKTGMFGVSMGGSLAIQYAALHPEIRALVADSAFSSMTDTIDASVRHFTGLPPFPFGPMIRFWAEREDGFDMGTIDAKTWVSAVSPRPILIMQGGADEVISVSSGQKLFDAAGQPKTFWFEPAVEHGRFLDQMPSEFERRVVGFFDAALK